ncbi:MAG: ATP synthase F1 subunit delta [Bacillota bacterium]
MLNNQIAEKYSQSLFELAIEKEEAELIAKELTTIIETIQEHEDLNEVIYHPRIAQQNKKALVEQIFSSEVSQTVENFVKLLIDKRREMFLEAIADNYIQLMNQQQDLLEVQVKSAQELTTENENKLRSKLEDLTDKEVSLNVKVDSSLIGGLVIKIDDQVIDGSLVKHLESMKSDLTKMEVGVN